MGGGWGTTHSDGLFLDVLESRLGHTLALELVTHHGEGCGRAQLLGALAEDDAPLGRGRRLGDGAVVGFEVAVALEGLDPTAGLEALVCLLEQRGPVRHAADKPSHVHVVEGALGEGPFLRKVIDLAVGQLEISG